MNGSLAKVTIPDIQFYKLVEKSGTLQFEFSSNGNVFILKTGKDSKVNFELIDRIIRGICIQTNIASRRVPPKNMWPIDVNVVTPNSIDCSARTIRRMRNGTIYQSGEIGRLSPEETKIRKQLRGIGAPAYSDKQFYDSFRETREQFIERIQELEDPSAELMKLWEMGGQSGRKVDLKSRYERIQQNLEMAI